MRSIRFASWLRATAFATTLAVTSVVGASASIAPSFSLPSRSGDIVALDKLKGQVVMINFWASWCGPCQQEMPLLDKMYKRYSPLGFTLLGVNVDEQRTGAETVLAKVPVTFPVLFDQENKVSKLFAVQAMPSSVFIDRKGTVRYVHHGYKPGDESEYLNQIRALLKE
jgi:peroxiredoxin